MAFITRGADVKASASPGHWVVPLGIVLSGSLAVGVSLIANDSVILAGLAILATAVEAVVLFKAAGQFTPAMIPVLIINIMGVFGFLFYDRVANVATVSARLPTSDSLYVTALAVVLGFTAALTVGALIILLLQKGRTGSLTMRGAVRIKPAFVLVLGFAPLLALIIGKGSALIQAPTYLDAFGPPDAAIIGSSLAPAAILALALAAFRKGTTAKISWLGLLAWALVLFCIATRLLAAMPGLLLVGYMLVVPGEKRRRVGVRKLSFVTLATLILSQLPLTLRGTTAGVGFIPFVERLAADPWLVFGVLPEAVVGNLLFGLPLTGFVTQSGRAPAHEFWTSVTPLPSGLTDWDQVAPTLRVNVFTPYNGLGELGTQGWFYLIPYGIAVGVVFSLAHRRIVGMSGTLRLLTSVLVVALAYLFAVDMLQYNLRSSTRIVWYLVAFVAVLDFKKLLNRHAAQPRSRQ